jgi:Flp pilus assembly protein TadB
MATIDFDTWMKNGDDVSHSFHAIECCAYLLIVLYVMDVFSFLIGQVCVCACTYVFRLRYERRGRGLISSFENDIRMITRELSTI